MDLVQKSETAVLIHKYIPVWDREVCKNYRIACTNKL